MKNKTKQSDYRLEIICDEGHNYIAYYPQLPGCIAQDQDIQKAIEAVKQKKESWIKKALHTGEQVPPIDDTDNYSGQFKLRLPKSLHKALTENAKKEGISLNQYCVYLLSLNEVTRYRKSAKKNYYL